MGWDESRMYFPLLAGDGADISQGGEHYQSAFYVYEELASAPGTSAPLSIVGQAVAELHLGRLPEAEAALDMALEKYPEDVQVIANSVVLNVLAGKETGELEGYVIYAMLLTGLWFVDEWLLMSIDVFARSSRHILFCPMFRRRASSLILLLRSTLLGCLPNLVPVL